MDRPEARRVLPFLRLLVGSGRPQVGACARPVAVGARKRAVLLCIIVFLHLTFHPGAFAVDYYVNDASLVNDVYTSAVGNAGNDGLTTTTPRDSIQDILDTYDLEPGDTVYVDTGTYVLSSTITISVADSGVPGNLVTIQGSTHVDGSTIDRNDTGAGGVNIQASYFQLQNLRITGGRTGIFMRDGCEVRECEIFGNSQEGIEFATTGCTVADCVVRDNGSVGVLCMLTGGEVGTITGNTVRGNGFHGIHTSLRSGALLTVMNNALSGNIGYELYGENDGGALFTFMNNTVVSSGGGGVLSGQGSGMTIKNNIVHVDGAGNVGFYAYNGTTGSTLDYNDYYVTGGAGRQWGTTLAQRTRRSVNGVSLQDRMPTA